MRLQNPLHVVILAFSLLFAMPSEARLSEALCSEMRDAVIQMNASLPQTVKSPSVKNIYGSDEKVFLETTYLRVDVDCEEEAVIYEVRFASNEIEEKIKQDSKMANEVFYEMHNSQITMACRPSGFIKKFGLKQEVRTLLDRAGEVWHRWVTSSYDCL